MHLPSSGWGRVSKIVAEIMMAATTMATATQRNPDPGR